MSIKDWFKGAKAKAMVVLGSFAMILGVGASISIASATATNEVVETKAGSALSADHLIYLTDNFTSGWSAWAGTCTLKLNTHSSSWSLVEMDLAYTNSSSQQVFVGTLPSGTTEFNFCVNTTSEGDKWSGTFSSDNLDFDSVYGNDDQEYYWSGGWSGANFDLNNVTITKYTVNYHANGGTGTMDSETAYVNGNYTVAENGFTRSGYTFQKWCNSALGEGDIWLNAGDTYVRTTSSSDALNLYPVWIPDTFRFVWNNVNSNNYIYLWEGDGTTHNTGWDSNTGTSFTANGQSYYYFDFDYKTQAWIPDYVIFHNNKGTQTGDLEVPVKSWDGAYYFYLESAADDAATLTPSVFSVSSSGTNGTVTVASYGTHSSALAVSWASEGATGYDYVLTSTTIYAGTDNSGTVLATYTSGTSGSFTMSGKFYPQIFIETIYTKTPHPYEVTIAKGTGVSSVYLSATAGATSGSASGTTFDFGTTVYGFAVLKGGYAYNTSWTTYVLVSGTANTEGAIYRIGSLTVEASGNDFGTIAATSGETAAITYAANFNTEIGGVCQEDNTTNTTTLVTKWTAQDNAYDALYGYVQYWLGKETHSSNATVTTMLAKYDYVCGKYGSNGKKISGITDFLGRNPSAPAATALNVPGPSQDQSPLTLTLWIVLGAGVAGMAAIGAAYFVSKKKKRHQA